MHGPCIRGGHEGELVPGRNICRDCQRAHKSEWQRKHRASGNQATPIDERGSWDSELSNERLRMKL